MKKCKFPTNPCMNRYFSERRGYCCRLDEWKRKRGVCKYDSNIKSKSLMVKKAQRLIKEKYQTTL